VLNPAATHKPTCFSFNLPLYIFGPEDVSALIGLEVTTGVDEDDFAIFTLFGI